MTGNFWRLLSKPFSSFSIPSLESIKSMKASSFDIYVFSIYSSVPETLFYLFIFHSTDVQGCGVQEGTGRYIRFQATFWRTWARFCNLPYERYRGCDGTVHSILFYSLFFDDRPLPTILFLLFAGTWPWRDGKCPVPPDWLFLRYDADFSSSSCDVVRERVHRRWLAEAPPEPSCCSTVGGDACLWRW